MHEREKAEARRYFEELYPPQSKVAGYLSICYADPATNQSGGLTSIHLPANNAADLAEAAVVLSLEKGKQVWSSVCAHATDGGPYKRGTRADVCALPGFWVDIDLAGPGHAAEDLPPTLAAAVRQILIPLDLEPSLLLHTGGGLHAYWLLGDPEPVTNANRAELQTLAHALQDELRSIASAHGWKLDKTSDLSRILRPAGTTNRKPGRAEAPEVAILMPEPPPYSIDTPAQVRYSLADLHTRFAVVAPPAPAARPGPFALTSVPAAPAPEGPTEVWTFESTREEVTGKMRNNKKPERFDMLQAILLGQPFAAKGERDQKLQQAASWLAWYCPEGDPEAILEILRPSLEAMAEQSPEDHPTKEQAMDKIQRAQADAVRKKAAAADADARLSATLRGTIKQ